MKAAAVLALALAGVAAGTEAARAQSPAPGAAEPDKTIEAQRRFQRGIELYKEGDFNGALVEFKRAYELVPTYKILYNLGQVSYQRHDYAGALHYFRRYLTAGGQEIAIERQNEVAGDIHRLEPRVGTLEVQSVETGAEVFVDDILIGTTPLAAPITVNSGRRKVDLVARGGEHRARMVDVPGRETVRVTFPRLVLQPADLAPRHDTDALTVTQGASPAAPPTAPAPARKVPWISWAATGVLAGGATATAVMAIVSKRELDSQLMMFPLDDVEVDYYSRRTRGFALATDGLLIATTVMTAVSLYLTLRSPK